MDKKITEAADILNSLILRSLTTAVGRTGIAGAPGQQITVLLEKIGSVQAICAEPITPGLVEARKTNRGWIIRSANQPRRLESVRQIRRGKEVKQKTMNFCFIYLLKGKLHIGGLATHKAVEHPLVGVLAAASIHHKGQRYLAIARYGNSLLSVGKSPEPSVFSDSRVPLLSPVGGGVWVGQKSTFQPGTYVSSENTSVDRQVVERFEINGAFVIKALDGSDPNWYIFGRAIPAELNQQKNGGVLGILTVAEEVFGDFSGFINGEFIRTDRAWKYFDYVSIVSYTGSFSSKQTIQYESLLFYNGSIEVGAGSETIAASGSATGPSAALAVGSTVETKNGSGETCILPGLRLPWSSSRTKTTSTGQPSVEVSSSSQYSLPLLINNQATSAIVTYTVEQGSAKTVTYLIVSRQPPEPGQAAITQFQALNAEPVFSVAVTGNTPVTPTLGEMTVPVGNTGGSPIIGMKIVVAVQQGNKVLKGIGTLLAVSPTGWRLQITSVLSVAYDRMATKVGQVYSNNGSIRSLVENRFSYTYLVWERNTIYAVDLFTGRDGFGEGRIHFAEAWKFDTTQSPWKIYKQPKPIVGNKVPLSANAEEDFITNIAGSYSP